MPEDTIISNLPEKQLPDTDDNFIIEDITDTKRITFSSIFNAIKNKLSQVATTGNYNDLSGRPALGTSASKNVANNCTTTEEGSVMDARQGPVIQENITAISNKVGNLSSLTTAEKSTIVGALNELKRKDDELNSALSPKITEYTSLKNGWITNGLCCTAVVGKIVFVRMGLKGGTVGTEIELLSGLPKIATGSAVRISGASDVGYNGYAEVKNNSSGVPAIFLRYITSNTNVMLEFFYLTA